MQMTAAFRTRHTAYRVSARYVELFSAGNSHHGHSRTSTPTTFVAPAFIRNLRFPHLLPQIRATLHGRLFIFKAYGFEPPRKELSPMVWVWLPVLSTPRKRRSCVGRVQYFRVRRLGGCMTTSGLQREENRKPSNSNLKSQLVLRP